MKYNAWIFNCDISCNGWQAILSTAHSFPNSACNSLTTNQKEEHRNNESCCPFHAEDLHTSSTSKLSASCTLKSMKLNNKKVSILRLCKRNNQRRV
uniref:Uncharacterized protein n=1 Tax=Rhizophora mucronata TaxID=61149 RepID=A0A2P2NYB4_RHIMU